MRLKASVWRFFGDIVKHDPSIMRIAAENMFDARTVSLNATFIGLVAYRHRRPDSWGEYVRAILGFRSTVCACLRGLHAAWEAMLSEQRVRPVTIQRFPESELRVLENLGRTTDASARCCRRVGLRVRKSK